MDEKKPPRTVPDGTPAALPETSPPDPLSREGERETSSPLPRGRGAVGEVLKADSGSRIVLADLDPPPSEEERIASARLRDALADPAVPNDDAEFARTLALAHAPREIASDDHRAIVDRAVANVRPRGKLVRAAFGAVATLALAAAAMLALGRADMSQNKQLLRARSTQELFDEPFAKPLSHGAASARMDRIAMARGSDLRENRFAMWGVP